MRKITLTGEEARKAIKKGVNEVADILKKTLGPHGRNVLANKLNLLSYENSDDGFTILEEIQLDDEIKNLAAKMLLDACSSTNSRTGDGTTSTVVLARAIFNRAYERAFEEGGLLQIKENPVELRNKINQEMKLILEEIDKLKRPMKDSEIYKVVEVSSQSPQVAEIITEALKKNGREIALLVEETYDTETTSESVRGLEIPSGFIHPYLANMGLKAVFNNANVMFTNEIISTADQLIPIVTAIKKDGGNHLVLVARAFNHTIIPSIVQTHLKTGFTVLGIQFPTADEVMEDYAQVTGTVFFDENKGKKIAQATLADLGKVPKVIADRDRSFIILDSDSLQDDLNSDGIKTRLSQRIETIKEEQKKEKPGGKMYIKLGKRIGLLSGGVCVIKVGGINEGARIHLRKKVEDAKGAIESAVKDGVVQGGGLTLKKIGDKLGKKSVIGEALSAPYEVIQDNAMPNKLEIGKDILDPAIVVKTAVENACKIAGLMLCTDTVMADQWIQPCTCNDIARINKESKEKQEKHQSNANN